MCRKLRKPSGKWNIQKKKKRKRKENKTKQKTKKQKKKKQTNEQLEYFQGQINK